MKCTTCGKKAVIERIYEGRALCKDHFLKSVEKTVSKTIRDNNLLKRGEHIAVGFSGGKDSSMLLYTLKKLSKARALKLSAILVDEGIKDYRNKSIPDAKKFCENLGIELHIVSFKKEIGKTLDKIMAKNKDKTLNGCTYCGVFRRKLINEKAREIGANKVAIGHNLDDEVQSIMANYIRGDILRGARIGAKAFVAEDKKFVPRIKPLRDVPEKECALYCILKGFDVNFGECPYASESFRWSVRDIVNDLEEKYPGTKFSILRTFDRILPAIQKTAKTKGKIEKCTLCGEPTSREICKACELKKLIQ
ncbi:MAG: TIGR00269 family protein [Candidatus Aenigmarchaeota archaeon]|nr:TIGR00269 family protein [Candidatus Aenigmarchaeota archaeon]